MKKLLVLIGFIMLTTNITAQTKTAYCDIYARGGGKNMKISIMYNKNPINWSHSDRTNLGAVLNLMADNGWILDKEIVIPKQEFRIFPWLNLTRHKLHLIMKKEYQTGEDPFFTLQHVISRNEINVPYKIGDAINHNGVSATVAHIMSNFIILAAKEVEGTWDEAVRHCSGLGNDWRLPSVEECSKIIDRLNNNDYWTINEVNEKHAKVYGSCYSYTISKHKRCSVLPITIVNIKDFK